MFFILIFLIGVAADQALKQWAATSLDPLHPWVIIPGFFSLTHVINRGAAWSFLANQSWGIHVLTGISFLAFLALTYLVITTKERGTRSALLLMNIGCVGNLIDRALAQGVVDLFSFQFGSYSFPVFNLADVFLVLGVVGLLFFLFFPNAFPCLNKKPNQQNPFRASKDEEAQHG